MNWMEVIIGANHETAELIADFCGELGANGVVIEDPRLVNGYLDAKIWDYTDIKKVADDEIVTIKTYLAQDDENLNDKLRRLDERLKIIAPTATVSFGVVKDEDWANSWKQYWHTQKVGEKLVIKPTWEEYTPHPGEQIIELDPGSAFGTGSHPTTLLCLHLLEKYLSPGEKAFDMGTGSGILAIAAAKLGAGEVIAADADAAALESATANAAQNHVTAIVTIIQSDLWQNIRGKANIIVANIIADVIIRLLQNLREHLTAGGKLIAGGIIVDRVDDVRQAVQKENLTITEMREEKGWAAMVIEGVSEE